MRAELLIFPAAYMSITYAITGLLVAFGLFGRSELAAEIAVAQAAAIATFYAFSANTRNLILGESGEISAADILLSRLLLVVPLAALAFLLSIVSAGISAHVALVLVLRRSIEWLNEVHLCRMEVRRETRLAAIFLLVQAALFMVAVVMGLMLPRLAWVALYAWALLPLALSLPYLIAEVLPPVSRFARTLPKMLPHFASTAMLGISIYAFRLLIVLLLPKSTAGDLFTAIAIGSFMGSLFANVLGPTLVLHGGREGRVGLPRLLTRYLFATLTIGLLLFWAATVQWAPLAWLGKSYYFWAATGLSLMGGVVMVLAQRIRLLLLRDREGADVFGPDVLINILLVTAIPVFFSLADVNGMLLLYPLNAVLAYMFYWGSHRQGHSIESIKTWSSRGSFARLIIAIGLILPLFFLLTGKIYSVSEPVIDSGGVLQNLPIPVSLLACFSGLLIVGKYRKATLGLTVVFLSFALMLAAALVTTSGELANERSKLLLMLQFLLPTFALTLGLAFELGHENQNILERSIVYVLALVVPTQLILSWADGTLALKHSLYLFSIYQHQQYVPVMFVSGYLIALSTLWLTGFLRPALILIGLLLGIYAAASYSMLSLALLLVGMVGFGAHCALRSRDFRPLLLSVLTFSIAASYLFVARDTITFDLKYGFLYGKDRPYAVDAIARIVTFKDGVWTIKGQPAEPFAQLITYVTRTVNPGHVFIAKGKLLSGGLKVGLVADGQLVKSADVAESGEFSIALRPGSGRVTAVVASYLPTGGAIDAHIEHLGWQVELTSPDPGSIATDARNRLLSGTSWIPMNVLERLYDWKFYGARILTNTQTLLFGHPRPLDRAILSSAHNYYLDFTYNFGVIAILPLVGLVIYTLHLVWRHRRAILRAGPLFGLTGVVLFLLLVDNNFKVTMRQPYPGILTFFLWGVLLMRLRRLEHRFMTNSAETGQKRKPFPGM